MLRSRYETVMILKPWVSVTNEKSIRSNKSFIKGVGILLKHWLRRNKQKELRRNHSCSPSDWLKFNSHEFTSDSRKEFRNRHKELLRKEIEGPKALDYVEDRTYTSQAWNRLFRIREQLGGVKRSMSMRQFSLALGLYTTEEMNNNLFEPFCRYDANEKVTLDDLFMLHSMDGGEMVDVPWTVAKFLSEKAKGYKKKNLICEAHLIRRIARSYGLMAPTYMRILMDDKLDNSKDEAAAVEARRAQDEEGHVRRTPNMSFTQRLRAMDDRMGDMDASIYKLSNDIEEITAVQGVNYMASPQVFSTAPTPSPNPFGLFDDAGAGPSTSHNQGNDMDED
ncbi:hypothetical protein Tco_0259823 [Tanacetum coccineum]